MVIVVNNMPIELDEKLVNRYRCTSSILHDIYWQKKKGKESMPKVIEELVPVDSMYTLNGYPIHFSWDVAMLNKLELKKLWAVLRAFRYRY